MGPRTTHNLREIGSGSPVSKIKRLAQNWGDPEGRLLETDGRGKQQWKGI